MHNRGRPIPALSDLVEYDHTVAGHAGPMCDSDGELFIKPCTQTEIDFYEAANANYPEFSDIMPEFYGILSLTDAAELLEDPAAIAADINVHNLVVQAGQEKTDTPTASSSAVAEAKNDKDSIVWIPNKAKKIKTDQSVVLQNATKGFARPNILDTKLGRRLWADDAPLQKKQRFDKIASETTHAALHFRIAGMRVYRGSTTKSELNAQGYRIYDKDYGRFTVNTDNVADAFRTFVFNPTAGIDADLGRAVAQAFARDLRRVADVLRRHEIRMYSASLLFIFEGDGDKLREAIEANNRAVEAVASASASASATEKKETAKPVPTSLRVDSGIALMAEDEAHDGDADVDNDEGYDDDDDDEDQLSSLPMIYKLKLIDFAHAQWTPGLGPDENVLIGVEKLIEIFEKLAA
ncbi:SAICAR synthase-like protein [Sodiomyces alkalinus F11]|uniref:Kinase n=1 Tax=Sodiomyces alkalinus (strain CBS 110278 / VKM F-3762 / F11) TaxID=1314773 RepID=A0A3N2Q5Z9_SODAK|nr:SAICAR synthase-like protein [Sodiomyces alkalinus F11]ROT42182.1 SAICAR synthase-like protein [Sodiomyces alkalinus F11]